MPEVALDVAFVAAGPSRAKQLLFYVWKGMQFVRAHAANQLPCELGSRIVFQHLTPSYPARYRHDRAVRAKYKETNGQPHQQPTERFRVSVERVAF